MENAHGAGVQPSGGGGVSELLTVKDAVRMSVPPAVLATAALIVCVPLTSLLVSYGIAVLVASALLPAKSYGAPVSVLVGVPVRAVLSSQNLTFVIPVCGLATNT